MPDFNRETNSDSQQNDLTFWMQPKNNAFSCVIVGEGELPLACARLIQQRAHVIKMVISPEAGTKDWCEKHSIPYFSSVQDQAFRLFLNNISFDYLFSVNNNWILKPWFLNCAKRLAINYHNAFLPEYGGVHATSWAIYNQENKHGITLHVMTEHVDGGDILLQKNIDILPNDTALSLNIRCQQEFLEHLFPELMTQIECGQLKRTPQVTTERAKQTFHFLKNKIDTLLSWNQSASAIERTYRALKTGSYQNRLGIPGFIWNDQLFFVKQMTLCKKIAFSSNALPGQLLDISIDEALVQTSDGILSLKTIMDIDGKEYTFDGFSKRYGVKKGDLLPVLSEDERNQLVQQRASTCEFFWEKQLRFIEPPLSIPFQDMDSCSLITNVDAVSTHEEILTPNVAISSKQEFLALFLLYLSKFNQMPAFCVAFVPPTENLPFLSNIVPLSLTIDFEKPCVTLIQECLQTINSLNNKGTYFTDLPHRITDFQLEKLNFFWQIDLQNHTNAMPPNTGCRFKFQAKQLTLQYPNAMSETFRLGLKIMMENLGEFIIAAKKAPNTTLRQLPLLSANQKFRQLTQGVFEHHSDYHHNQIEKISWLFEQKASEYPSIEALRLDREALTYQQLNYAANQLAHLITQYQPHLSTREFIVVICLERSFEMITSILGTLKAGAAYVPIDPHYPSKRIEYILDDINPTLVLTQREIIERHELSKYKQLAIFALDDNQTTIKNQPTNNLCLSSYNPQNLAYIFYTSGTTGKPKGVMMTNDSLLNRLNWMKKQFALKPTERVLHKTPFVFDWSFAEIMLPLISGSCLVIARPDEHKDPRCIAELISREKINYLHFVPSMLKAFLDYAESIPEKETFQSLKCLFLSGEAVAADTVNRAKCLFNCEFYNLYGPTECGEVSYHSCEHIPGSNVPIGRPITNAELYVLNKDMELSPTGAIGEFYIGNKVLGLGYWQNPKLTEEKFINNPFFMEYCMTYPKISSRLYKTGDLARVLPDGNFEYLGRLDRQVKIRGIRIELSGIETILRKQHDISDCIVAKWNQSLLAYVTLTSGSKINGKYLLASLHAKLPEYMVPEALIVLDRIPTDHNGKVGELPKPTRDQLSHLSYKPATTILQKALATMWEELLDISPIGVHDNFVKMGGNSIILTQLLSRIKAQYGVHISLPDFLDNPTLTHLASLIEGKIFQKTNACLEKDWQEGLDKITQFINNSIYPYPSDFKCILLTGASGFLGINLLHQLCLESRAEIYCLIRAEDESRAKEKLEKSYRYYHPHDSIIAKERVKVVLGDLTLPKLGMKQQQFDELINTIDVIYHSGANVHHLYNYETLRACNVLSTVELLKLTTQGKPKVLHYISTLPVAKKDEYGFSTDILLAFNDCPPMEANGYLQTKWMSEYLLAQAYKLGVPISIFRPSWITGRSDSGIFSSVDHDHLSLLIKACIQLKYAPNWDIVFNMMPVDLISQLIVNISFNITSCANPVFNLSNKHCIHWRDLMEWIAKRHPITLISPQDWHKKLAYLDKDNALYSLLSLYQNEHPKAIDQRNCYSKNNSVSCFLSDTKTLFNYYPVDDKLLNRYFEFFYQCGFLDKPNNDEKSVQGRAHAYFFTPAIDSSLSTGLLLDNKVFSHT